MKSYFDIVLLLFITLTMFISMMFFVEEITVEQEGIHLRNRIIELIEINNGYTNKTESEVNDLINRSSKNIVVNVNKKGILKYGEEVVFEIVITYERKLPFDKKSKSVEYKIIGEYYNING